MVHDVSADDVKASTADANDLTAGDVPILARSAIAGHDDDLRAFTGGASLHIEAEAPDSRDVTLANRPLLIQAAMTGEQRRRRAIDRDAVGDIHALWAVRAQ